MARRAVIVMLDGLRRDFVRPDLTPELHALAADACVFPDSATVFPSCTRVASASIATGCRPGRHGIEGNTLALMEDGRPVLRDVGPPGFFAHRRAVTGRAMDVPTLAERVAGHGGSIVFSNVSPGAAFALDPDGHGFVYHRALSAGPGGIPVPAGDALAVGPGIEGDRAMTERFCDEVLLHRRPALAVLWCGSPDTGLHANPPGSPAAVEAVAAADLCARRVAATCRRLEENGDEVLLIVASDHGHQTVEAVVDVAGALVDAGLKDAPESDDVVVAPNGTAALIYLHPAAAARAPAIAGFLRDRPWAGRVAEGEELRSLGLSPGGPLAVALSLRDDDAPNAHGVPGRSFAAAAGPGKAVAIGCGQHGGLGRYERMPFLMIRGPGFPAGTRSPGPASLIDFAPTVLRHLGLAADGMDGGPLQLARDP
ncbi:alkaline phosphatase family protein [Azospirillum halopraeferens]|uniref:alkaline phosphatase family protein n=1 Tax=Azospirillum halopraeferens TaxID=34010 RepID=UPI000408BAD1|nr:alkaline phosphatase family protein [Azospirillum halopraeferens]